MKMQRKKIQRLLSFFTVVILFITAFTSCYFIPTQPTETTLPQNGSDSTAPTDSTTPPATTENPTGTPGAPFVGTSVYAKATYPKNAQGAVSFVVDDGYRDTATIISDRLLPKYDKLRISYALMANSLAELDSDYGIDGLEYYIKDQNGSYNYFFTNQSNLNFWKHQYADNGNYCEFLSHSYSHSMFGNDDNGGEQQVQTSNGLTTLITAKGTISAEVQGSQQIIHDLLNQESNYYVMPGTGQANSSYYLNMLESGAYYRGARTTNKVLNVKENIKAPFSYIDSWMVTPSEEASQWTQFIDNAVADGDWACFCIHNILEDSNPSPWGHYTLESKADELFGHADQLADEGKLWIGTMSEVADYLQYWNASTITALHNQETNIIRVSVTPDETVADYDVTLTVKVAVPQSWKSNSIKNASGTTLKTVEENGRLYVLVLVPAGTPYVDILPKW